MTEVKWVEVSNRDDVPDETVIEITVEGRDIALYGVDGKVYATDNLCTHGNARLCDGFLDGHEIECPLHQGMFDVRNGQPTCAPVILPLQTYPVKIDSGRVWVGLEQ